MLTAIGATAVCLSVIGIGIGYASSLKREGESIRGLLSLFNRIKARIECFRQPLSEIYQSFDDERLGETFTRDLNSFGLSFALTKNRRALGIDEELYERINELACQLGKSYASDQIRLCDGCIKELEESLKKCESTLPSRTRLCITLSVGAAAMTAILLL